MVYFEVCRSICDLFHYIYRICLHALKEEKTKMNQKDKVIEAFKGNDFNNYDCDRNFLFDEIFYT